MFEVIDSENNRVLGPYETSVYASSQAKERQKTLGGKFRIRKIVTESWRDREATRLKNGTYKPLPDWWLNSSWWINSQEAVDHYAHMASDGKRIAFTESPTAGEADRQLTMAASRYLGRYFSFALGSEEIRDIAYMLENEGNTRFVYKTSDLPEDFERVFEDQDVGFDGSSGLSCMRHSRSHFGSCFKHHPAYVYGAGDLIIAWLEDCSEENFTVCARAVCNKHTKAYVRIYAKAPLHRAILASKLVAEGYYQGNSIAEAKLLKIAHEDLYYINKNNTKYYMPYIDGYGKIDVDSHKDYFVLAETGPFTALDTCGLIDIPNSFICTECGTKSYYGQSIGGGKVCLECINTSFIFDTTDSLVRKDGIENTHTQVVVYYCGSDNLNFMWMPKNRLRYDSFVCEHTGYRMSRLHVEKVLYVTSERTMVVCEYVAESLGAKYCQLTKKYYSSDFKMVRSKKCYGWMLADPEAHGYKENIPKKDE